MNIKHEQEHKSTKKSVFNYLKYSFVKKKESLHSRFIRFFHRKIIDHDVFNELEEQLLISDIGVDTTKKIINNLVQKSEYTQLNNTEALHNLLIKEMSDILMKVEKKINFEQTKPFVILVIGVNGTGKTTTIAKLAVHLKKQNKSVILAAGDTFRAAAIAQLQALGEINRIPVIAQHTGSDSASVIFDAIQAGQSRNIDVLIADTAGRLQNKLYLMKELEKIIRVIKKLDKDAPHEIMLVIDANTGQNALNQTKLFHEAIGLTGITLTKLDGTAKGGVIFTIADQFRIPIRYVSVGEKMEDFYVFHSSDFIKAMFH